MKKSIIAIIAALSMFACFATGCGSNDDSATEIETDAVSEEETNVVSDAAADDVANVEDGDASAEGVSASEYAEALSGTLWVGIDTDYYTYALGFSDEQLDLEVSDGSSVSGYWGVKEGDPTIYVFNDAELTDQVGTISWSYDPDNKVMIVNDNVVLAQTDADNFDNTSAAMEQMATAAKVEEYLQGTYWISTSDTDAEVVSMDGTNFIIDTLTSEGELSENNFYWSIDYDNIYLYDDSYSLVGSFEWNMSTDGSTLELTKDTGEKGEFTQVSEDDATNIIAYLYASMGLEQEG